MESFDYIPEDIKNNGSETLSPKELIAREYIQRMNRIGECIKGYGKDGYTGNDIYLNIPSYQEWASIGFSTPIYEGSNTFTGKRIVNGIGTGCVGFRYNMVDFSVKPPSDELGFAPLHELYITVHTDLDTLPQVAELNEEREYGRDWSFSTEYYFDNEGNSGKYCTFPYEIDDGRPDAEWHHQVKYKHERVVKGEVLSGDYELIGFVLSKFEEACEYLKTRFESKM